MSAKIKSILHGIISIGGNVLLIGLVPMEYKAYAVMAFNLVQVIYAFYDPTYGIQIMAGRGQTQQ